MEFLSKPEENVESVENVENKEHVENVENVKSVENEDCRLYQCIAVCW